MLILFLPPLAWTGCACPQRLLSPAPGCGASDSAAASPRPRTALCAASAMALEVSAIELGLQPGEFVLRGGLLKGPTVVQGVKTVNGCGFVYLWKTSRWLNEFLAGSMKASRPLSMTTVPTGLQELREEARSERLRSTSGLDGRGLAPCASDPTAALCLDVPDAHPPEPAKLGWRLRASTKKLLLAMVEVTFEKGG